MTNAQWLSRLVVLVALLLSACADYDYRVNDRVVYSARPLFADYEIPDNALGQCVKQTIADGGITAPSQLRDLNCSHAGIAKLDGLAIFSGLLSLRLSANSVLNLVELGALKSLQELYLDNNRVVDPVPLYGLPELRFLDLSGNVNLQCPQGGALASVRSLMLPRHCR